MLRIVSYIKCAFVMVVPKKTAFLILLSVFSFSKCADPRASSFELATRPSQGLSTVQGGLVESSLWLDRDPAICPRLALPPGIEDGLAAWPFALVAESTRRTSGRWATASLGSTSRGHGPTNAVEARLELCGRVRDWGSPTSTAVKFLSGRRSRCRFALFCFQCLPYFFAGLQLC